MSSWQQQGVWPFVALYIINAIYTLGVPEVEAGDMIMMGMFSIVYIYVCQLSAAGKRTVAISHK